jgi:hypothetical protein
MVKPCARLVPAKKAWAAEFALPSVCSALLTGTVDAGQRRDPVARRDAAYLTNLSVLPRAWFARHVPGLAEQLPGASNTVIVPAPWPGVVASCRSGC